MSQKMDTKLLPPSEELHHAARAGFILQGTTFAKWCVANNVSHPNARQTLIGAWNGPAGKKLLKKIIKDSRAAELLALMENANDK